MERFSTRARAKVNLQTKLIETAKIGRDEQIVSLPRIETLQDLNSKVSENQYK